MVKRVLTWKLKLVASVILLLVLLQLSTAYIFGFIAERELNYQFSQFTKTPFFVVLHRDYHHGMFSSDITTEIAINSKYVNNILAVLNNGAGEQAYVLKENQLKVRYTTHVEQGIFAGLLNGIFIPTLACTKTNIIYPDNVKHMLDKFFDKNVPLTITNVMYINKSGYYRINSPTFDYDEAVSGVKVAWGGLQFIINYNNQFNHFNSTFMAPVFELTAPSKGSIAINGVQFMTDSHKDKNDITVGVNRIFAKKIALSWKDPFKFNLNPGDVLYFFTGISANEFLDGMDAVNPNNFTFNDVSYLSTSRDINNLLDAQAKINFASLVTNNNQYGPLNLNIAISHVDALAFSKLIHELNVITSNQAIQNQNDIDNSRQQMVDVLKKYFSIILVNNPLLTLNTFNLVTPSGVVSAQGYATTNNFESDDINSQQRFMQKLVLDIHLSVPRKIMAYLFELQMRYLLSAGNTTMDHASAQALNKVVNILLDNQVNEWSKKGYLANEHGILSSHLSLKDGKLLLNDHVATIKPSN